VYFVFRLFSSGRVWLSLSVQSVVWKVYLQNDLYIFFRKFAKKIMRVIVIWVYFDVAVPYKSSK